MASPSFEKLLDEVRLLPEHEQRSMLDILHRELDGKSPVTTQVPVDVDYLIQEGIIGAWADKNIDDPVSWLAEQRETRRNRRLFNF